MIGRDEFLKKYNHSASDFAATGLEWSALEAIYADHQSKRSDLVATGNLVSEHLRQIRQVHSLKMRIKDPEHLIDKIIRKKLKEPEREITIENYDAEITDLVGVRALHLFKEDWVHIHVAIVDIWQSNETPVANIRKGDPEESFKQHGLKIVEHPAGYRSVHYTVKSQPTKKISVVEIQVRTIFEEGWSEIDHQLRYPYEIENLILCNYLAILNRFAGGADEMGSFIRWLKSELEKRESAYHAEIKAYEAKNAEMIQNLESVKKKLNAESQERKKLQKTIDSLQSAKPPTLTPSSLPNYGFSGFPNSQKCEGCGQAYNSILGVCPNCATRALSGLGMRKCKECGTAIGLSTSIGSPDLCISCGSLKLMSGFQNTRTCRHCGKNFNVGIAAIVTDPVCDLCKATAI